MGLLELRQLPTAGVSLEGAGLRSAASGARRAAALRREAKHVRADRACLRRVLESEMSVLGAALRPRGGEAAVPTGRHSSSGGER